MQAPLQINRICLALWRGLEAGGIEARVHSVFRSAVNLEAGTDLITLLCAGRVLQPGSLLLKEERVPELAVGQALRLSAQGLSSPEGLLVDLACARPVDLSIPRVIRRPDALRSAAAQLSAYIGRKAGAPGLASLLKTPDNPYAAYLFPRVKAFRWAVREKDRQAALAGVASLAGCGVGLTPSSDDMLAGYLALLYACACIQGVLAVDLCEEAARATGRISANMLRSVGRGLASTAVLEFFVRMDGSPAELEAPIRRIASFGETSGLDILTGMCFALQDAAVLTSGA